MISIGIRELRWHASGYVRMAKAGRRVAVTERGALVAHLVPAEVPAGLLARREAAGEYLPPVGSVLDSDAWFQAAKRRGQADKPGFPRRKRALVPVRFYRGTFLLDGSRVQLPVARGCPELWVRLARPLPYPSGAVRSVTLLAEGGRLWLAVTAVVPVQQHDLDPSRVARVDLGIIHPYAVVTEQTGLLVSGRALRAENYLHLQDQQARQARAARRAPTPGQRRRIHQAQHQAAKQVIAFAVQQRVGTLLVGDPNGITKQDAGRVQDLRLRRWRRTHLLQALRDKAELGRAPSRRHGAGTA
jgi:antitoxin (DNA-binding transcriptional repressor) of toxin-antitoxin stability system